jgi:hypothetical protein
MKARNKAYKYQGNLYEIAPQRRCALTLLRQPNFSEFELFGYTAFWRI